MEKEKGTTLLVTICTKKNKDPDGFVAFRIEILIQTLHFRMLLRRAATRLLIISLLIPVSGGDLPIGDVVKLRHQPLVFCWAITPSPRHHGDDGNMVDNLCTSCTCI